MCEFCHIYVSYHLYVICICVMFVSYYTYVSCTCVMVDHSVAEEWDARPSGHLTTDEVDDVGIVPKCFDIALHVLYKLPVLSDRWLRM